MTEVEEAKKFQQKLKNILKELIERNEIEVYGSLKIEVANMDTLALIKRNKIYINIEARKYPKFVLKYIIAHELAHLVVKRHTKKFWETVKRIYPEYEKGRSELFRRVGNYIIQRNNNLQEFDRNN
jgi:predicted metal-dependent hydrolase